VWQGTAGATWNVFSPALFVPMSPAVLWFRSDLRLDDNPALLHASQSGQVVAIYYTTPKQWLVHDMADCRANFQMCNLQRLRLSLGVFRQVRQAG